MNTRTAGYVAGALLVLWLSVGLGAAQNFGNQSGGSGGGPTAALRMFDAGKDGLWLNRIEIVPFGKEFAKGYPSGGTVYIVDGDLHVLRSVALLPRPGAAERMEWQELPIPAVQVPKSYGIAIAGGDTPRSEPSVDVNSYEWRFGDPPARLNCQVYMIRPTVSDTPATPPGAADLVMLQNGEAFFDHFVKMNGDPPSLEFAKHGPVAAAALYGLSLNAATTPKEELWIVVNGQMLGKLVSADEQAIVFVSQTNQQPKRIPRAEVQELSLRRVLISPERAGSSAGGSSRGGSSSGGSSGGGSF